MFGSWYCVVLGVYVGFESDRDKIDQLHRWHDEALAMLGDDDPDVREAAYALQKEIARTIHGATA